MARRRVARTNPRKAPLRGNYKEDVQGYNDPFAQPQWAADDAQSIIGLEQRQLRQFLDEQIVALGTQYRLRSLIRLLEAFKEGTLRLITQGSDPIAAVKDRLKVFMNTVPDLLDVDNPRHQQRMGKIIIGALNLGTPLRMNPGIRQLMRVLQDGPAFIDSGILKNYLAQPRRQFDVRPLPGILNKAISSMTNYLARDTGMNIFPFRPQANNFTTGYGAWGLTNPTQKLQDRLQIAARQQQAKMDVTNAGNPYYRNMARLDMAQYKDGRWIGQKVNQNIIKGEQRLTKNTQKFQQASAMLASRLSADQIKDQVPELIARLVEDDEQLSTTGFGPISATSSSLYVGRWVDPVTGRIRILPSVSSKYLNPLSAPQKQAYYKAKMLNAWNQIIAAYDQQIKWGKPGAQAKLTRRIQKTIRNAFNVKQSNIDYVNFISRTIVNFLSTPPITVNLNANSTILSAKYLILSVIPPDVLARIFKITPEVVTQAYLNDGEDTQDNITADLARFDQLVTAQAIAQAGETSGNPYSRLRYKITAWQTAVSVAAQHIRNQVTTDKAKNTANSPQYLKIIANINNAQFGLVTIEQKRLKKGLQTLNKAMVLPLGAATIQESLAGARQVDEMGQRLRKQSAFSLASMGNEQLVQILRLNDYIARNGFITSDPSKIGETQQVAKRTAIARHAADVANLVVNPLYANSSVKGPIKHQSSFDRRGYLRNSILQDEINNDPYNYDAPVLNEWGGVPQPVPRA